MATYPVPGAGRVISPCERTTIIKDLLSSTGLIFANIEREEGERSDVPADECSDRLPPCVCLDVCF